MTSHANSIGIRQSKPATKLSVFGVVLRIASTIRQRKALGKLDDAALRDIGLTRQQAATEAKRPIWNVPGHWRR